MSSQSLLIALAILSSSFWGSWHCAAMCGPVASLMAEKRSLFSYHSGRGMSYILLGVLGGYLGSFFLTNNLFSVRLYSGIVFAILLFVMGIQTFRGIKIFSSPKIKWIHEFYTPKKNGFILGLMSAFLPCGWLYSYVLAAAATQSAKTGALVMVLFWIGGLPALSSVSVLLAKAIHVAPKTKQRTAGLVLVFASIYSLFSFYFLHSLH